jgi:hypothetical protein
VTPLNFVCKCRAPTPRRKSGTRSGKSRIDKIFLSDFAHAKFRHVAEVSMECGFSPRDAARIGVVNARRARLSPALSRMR